MSISRRGFVRAAGLGVTGAFSLPFIISRGSEAAAFEIPDPRALVDGIIKISSNENARGPGLSAIRAIQGATSERLGRGYSPDHTAEFVDTVARTYGVMRDNVVVSTGSGALLAAAPRAFCGSGRHLVTASPTYGTPASASRQIGVDVRSIAVDSKLGLDLGAMADAARGAGLVFLCNPNNPTGTVYPADVVEEFVRTVKRNSPDTAILIDEAYMEYTHDPEARTAAALTMEFPGVFITRTFSKAYGMAGLRVGYAIGQEDTMRALRNAWGLGSMNALSAAAATAAILDTDHLEAERKENARIRRFVVDAFNRMGYPAQETHTNFVFVELGRPASWFRDACFEHGFQVGRDFPPMEQTHSRISLGTMGEMEQAVEVFEAVLSA